MALYRLHRKEWDKNVGPLVLQGAKKKRKGSSEPMDLGDVGNEVGGKESMRKVRHGEKKGVSADPSTVIRRGKKGVFVTGTKSKGSRSGAKQTQWWKELGGTSSKSS